MMLADNKASGWYDNACSDYADTEIERTNNLNNMQKIITRLLKKGNTQMGTQTDPIEGFELNGGNELASENDQDPNTYASSGDHSALQVSEGGASMPMVGKQGGVTPQAGANSRFGGRPNPTPNNNYFGLIN